MDEYINIHTMRLTTNSTSSVSFKTVNYKDGEVHKVYLSVLGNTNPLGKDTANVRQIVCHAVTTLTKEMVTSMYGE